jgi:hypothetical protein
LSAVSREGDVIVWGYPSCEILFQKKLNESITGIEWNPFRPNVFVVSFETVGCFFFKICFHVSETRHVISFFLKNIRSKTAKSNLLTCLKPQHFLIPSSRIYMISRHFCKSFFFDLGSGSPLSSPLRNLNKKPILPLRELANAFPYVKFLLKRDV